MKKRMILVYILYAPLMLGMLSYYCYRKLKDKFILWLWGVEVT